MARIDDYLEARRIAVNALNDQTLDAICNRSGYDSPDGQSLNIPFLDRRYRVRYPDFPFDDRDDPEREVPIQEQVLILHYLMGAGTPAPSGQWIAYREIPGAAFYNSAFVKRAIDPLKKVSAEDRSVFPLWPHKSGAGRSRPGMSVSNFCPCQRCLCRWFCTPATMSFPPREAFYSTARWMAICRPKTPPGWLEWSCTG